jgi:hypothetical protein
MKSNWLGRIALIALLAASCGPIHGVATAPSTASSERPTPVATTYPVPATASSARLQSPCPAVQPAPQFPASAVSSRNLALVTLRGSNSIIVRDITDIAHPTTIGALGTIPAPVGYGPSLEGALGQFVGATELSYLGGPTDDYYGLPTSLFRISLPGLFPTTVVKGCQGVVVFAWNPSGVAVVYLTSSDTGITVRQLTAGRDRVLASLPFGLPIGGCEVAPCPGPFQNPADKWDFRLSYSPDGAYIAVVQNGISSFFRVWGSDGTLLSSADGGGATMSVWSRSSLYFRDATGVEVWRNGVISTFLRGVEWIRPKASPDGRLIVYEARQLGSAHVFIVDTTSGQVRDLGQGRSEPAFLTPRYVWYQAEPVCVAASTCEPSVPGIASGKTYIYDLQDGTETESIITSVLDVWPHAA